MQRALVYTRVRCATCKGVRGSMRSIQFMQLVFMYGAENRHRHRRRRCCVVVVVVVAVV